MNKANDHSKYQNWIDPSECIPYEKNAKEHTDKQIKNIANSIKRFGWQQDTVITSDYVLVIGHGRRLAAIKLGCQMPYHMIDKQADELTDKDIRELRIADNQTNSETGYDFDLLNEDIEGLDFDGFDFDFMPSFDDSPADVGEDSMPEVQEEAVAQFGQIYQLGDHRLMCGDSTDAETVKILMGGAKADMVYTDPPYGMNAVSKSGVLSEHYKTDIMGDDDNSVAIKAFRMANVLFNGEPQIWWGANYYTECIPSSECWIVWDKNNGASDQTDCELAYTNLRSVVRQFTMASEKTNRVHPTQKPVQLFVDIMNKFDKVNGIKNVVDLFGGSGSTLIACEQTGRKCYMMELDPHYVDVIIARWEKLTGEKAVLLNEP